ncbi:MAG TPA: hypothetical protein VNO31_13065 [Umezawaea sp.]|nr:hypothetical protein [Umezawaea sp.]
MRRINRVIVAGALSIPLALAASGIASADTDTSRDATYYESTSTAGPHGASSHVVYSSADDGWGWGHGGYGHGYGWHSHGLLSGLLDGLI